MKLISVQEQVNEGIDAVIVDSVLKIRNGLTKNTKPVDVLAQPGPAFKETLLGGVKEVKEAVVV